MPDGVGRRAWPVVAVCAAFALAATACRDGSSAEDVVAKVAGTPIYRSQLDRMVAEARADAERRHKAFPDEDSRDFGRTRHVLLEQLVLDVEIAKMAQRLNVAVPAAAVFERAQEQREESGDEGSEEAEGEKATDEAASARSGIRARLLYEAVARKVTARAKVTPDEVSAYYRAHRAELSARGLSPARARLVAETTLLRLRQKEIMERWVRNVQRRFRPNVHYSKGY